MILFVLTDRKYLGQTSAQRNPTIAVLSSERCPYGVSSEKALWNTVNSSLVIPFSKHSTDFHRDVLYGVKVNRFR